MMLNVRGDSGTYGQARLSCRCSCVLRERLVAILLERFPLASLAAPRRKDGDVRSEVGSTRTLV